METQLLPSTDLISRAHRTIEILVGDQERALDKVYRVIKEQEGLTRTEIWIKTRLNNGEQVTQATRELERLGLIFKVQESKEVRHYLKESKQISMSDTLRWFNSVTDEHNHPIRTESQQATFDYMQTQKTGRVMLLKIIYMAKVENWLDAHVKHWSERKGRKQWSKWCELSYAKGRHHVHAAEIINRAYSLYFVEN